MAVKKIIDKNTIIEMFQKKKIRTFYDVPEEFRNDRQIIALQRQFRHRISNLRGYDVINNEFFVEESIAWDKQGREYFYDENKITFSTFGEYYNFLDGDIYENSCYYQYIFTDELINTYKIDLKKLNFSIKLESTVDDLKPNFEDRKQKYFESKKKLHIRKKWIEKFNEAKTYDDFMLVVHNYKKKHIDVDFYIWNYIATHGTNSFDIIVKYLSNNPCFDSKLVYAMCFVFGIEKVESGFKYVGMTKSTNTKRNAEFKRFVARFKSNRFARKVKTFFDIKTGYYCIKADIYESEEAWLPTTSLYKYFETFDELGKYLSYDFSNCDFTDAFELSEEKISNFNENTKFPIKSESQLNKIVTSYYDRRNKNFHVKTFFVHNKKMFIVQ